MRFKIKCSFGGISLQAGTLERGFTVLNCRNHPHGTALSPTVASLWTAYVFFYSIYSVKPQWAVLVKKPDLFAIFHDIFAYFRFISAFLGPTASWNPFFQIPRKILRGFMYFQPFLAIINDVLMLKWRNIMEKYQPPPPPWRRWAVKIGRYLVFIYAMISAVS